MHTPTPGRRTADTLLLLSILFSQNTHSLLHFQLALLSVVERCENSIDRNNNVSAARQHRERRQKHKRRPLPPFWLPAGATGDQ